MIYLVIFMYIYTHTFLTLIFHFPLDSTSLCVLPGWLPRPKEKSKSSVLMMAMVKWNANGKIVKWENEDEWDIRIRTNRIYRFMWNNSPEKIFLVFLIKTCAFYIVMYVYPRIGYASSRVIGRTVGGMEGMNERIMWRYEKHIKHQLVNFVSGKKMYPLFKRELSLLFCF